MAKNKTKFYAVKDENGGTIYTTWDECEKAVKGNDVRFKSFPTREDAQAYLDDVDRVYDEEIKPYLDDGWAVAYTDGSYNEDWRVYSYGVCLFRKDSDKPVELSGIGNKEEYAASANATEHNVAGEIQGVINAIRWAERNGYKRLLIYHDNEGVGKWADGVWHAKINLTTKYVDFIKTERKKLEIKFIWIKGHASNKYNERVDKLSREAIKEYKREGEQVDDSTTRIAGVREDDVKDAFKRLLTDYPKIKYTQEKDGGVKYSVTFDESKLSATLDKTGMLVCGEKDEFLYMIFVSYVTQAVEKRKSEKKKQVRK